MVYGVGNVLYSFHCEAEVKLAFYGSIMLEIYLKLIVSNCPFSKAFPKFSNSFSWVVVCLSASSGHATVFDNIIYMQCDTSQYMDGLYSIYQRSSLNI